MMKKIHYWLAGLLFLAVCAFLPISSGNVWAEEEEELTVSGEVVDVGEDSVTVDIGDMNITVTIDDTTEEDADSEDALDEAISYEAPDEAAEETSEETTEEATEETTEAVEATEVTEETAEVSGEDEGSEEEETADVEAETSTETEEASEETMETVSEEAEAASEDVSEKSEEEGVEIEEGDIVEIEAALGSKGLVMKRLRRPFKTDIVWDGPIDYDEENGAVPFGGISADVLTEEDGAPMVTEIIGSGGMATTIDKLDLNNVHVRVGYSEETGYFVKRIVQGPTMKIRGRIEDVSEDSIVVNGITVTLKENTRIRQFRGPLVSPYLSKDKLVVGAPVRVLTQSYGEENNALAILVFNNRRVKMRGTIQDINEEGGTATFQSLSGMLTLPLKLDSQSYKDIQPGQFIDFSGMLSGGMIDISNMGEVGKRPAKKVIRRAGTQKVKEWKRKKTKDILKDKAKDKGKNKARDEAKDKVKNRRGG